MLQHRRGALTLERRLGQDPGFGGSPGVYAERHRERQERDRQHNRPQPEPPAPVRGRREITCYLRSDPCRDEEGRVRQGGEESAVQQGGRVRDEDLLQDLQARRARCVEDLGGCEGLDVVGGGHLDVADDVDEDADCEGLEAAEDVGDLGHGWLDDG